MTPKSIRIARAAGLAVLGISLLAGASASAKDGPKACSEKPYVVKIHADWCRSCRALEALWARIESDLREQATPVTLDVSDRVAYSESQAAADSLGIGEFFQEYRSRTGTIAVLDCQSRQPVAILSAELDLEKYREAIIRAGG